MPCRRTARRRDCRCSGSSRESLYPPSISLLPDQVRYIARMIRGGVKNPSGRLPEFFHSFLRREPTQKTGVQKETPAAFAQERQSVSP
ncbi:MAG: hypothetical protein K0S10_3195 [Rubrobacteraceae bacterium]|nr:hypothetical protein [Rubrobacteraceae bacterium]